MNVKELEHILDREDIKSRPIDRYSYARDAGFYRLIPELVVQPKNEEQIIDLFDYCRSNKVAMVFRAAGTSLSGQSITDSILVEINKYWKDYYIADDASSIRLQAGIVGAHANKYLEPFKKKIGPDPASLNSCFIGGIVANNASGMSAGVRYNSIKTLLSMRIILPNGVVLDTKEKNADDEFRKKAPHIYQGLLDLRARVLASPQLAERIREKYTRKNTTGYSLIALVDFERPIDMLAHLMVGSEGTLGFISEVTLLTFDDKPFKSAALLLFQDIEQAAQAVFILKETGADALEIMDRAALRSVENEPGLPAELKTLPDGATALLCEYQDAAENGLVAKIERGRQALQKIDLLYPADFTRNEEQRLLFWKVRKGILPSAGGMRKPGTTVIIEDVGFRLKDLAPAIVDLQALFEKHGYEDVCIFGHTEAGNIHFIIAQEFADEKGLAQYRRFMDDVIDLTVNKYDGALKTEHGTGRNMAPFVETEWGQEAYGIMKDIKTLLDPDGILNPGVIINSDPLCHIKNIKPTPPVLDIVDKCIECGFCEIYCPSRDYTMTPRRRIATVREMILLERGSAKERKTAATLRRQYRFQGTDTCAADGLCAMGCPVNIDTGDLIRYFREQSHKPWSHRVAMWTVDHFGTVVKLLSTGLKAATVATRIAGRKNVTALSHWIHRTTTYKIPAWNLYMPTGAKKLPKCSHPENPRLSIVYFPSCLSRGMGSIKDETYDLSVPETIMRLCERSNIQVRYPDKVKELCCGTPYSSKGFSAAFLTMAERVTESLYQTSEKGRLPIVMDTSPCTYKIKHYGEFLSGDLLAKWEKLTIWDLVEFLHDQVLPALSPVAKAGTAVLHPTCSTLKMGQEGKMLKLAQACSKDAVIPDHHGCCAFAGDRGFLVADLTASATAREARDVEKISAENGHFSISRTCEIGMSSATNKPYSSIAHLLYGAIKDNEKARDQK